jgi:PAS domain S-box-containing protein
MPIQPSARPSAPRTGFWSPLTDPYRRLWIFLVALIVILLSIGFSTVTYFETHMLTRAGESLAIAATDTADKLDRLLYERYGDSRMMARAFSLEMHNAAYLNAYVTWMQTAYTPFYRWMGVTDATGRIIAATDAATIGEDRSTARWFHATPRDGTILIQDIKPHPEIGGSLAVSFSAAILDEKGQFKGVVTSLIDVPVLAAVVKSTEHPIQASLEISTQLEYVFVAQNGDILVSISEYQGPQNLKEVPAVQQLMATGKPGHSSEPFFGPPMPMVTGYAPTHGYGAFPGLGWSVLIRAPQKDVLAPILKIVGVLSLAVIGVLLPMFGALFWSARRLKAGERQLEQRVRERTHELEESENRLKLAQQVTNSGTWDWNPVTNHATWSEGAWEVFGLAPSNQWVTQEIWEQCLHPDDRSRAVQTTGHALKEAQTYFDQYRIVKPTGAICWVESQARVLRNEQGQPLRMIGVVRDITERKQMEQELQAIAWLLEQRNLPHGRPAEQAYGDLTELNTHRLLLDAVGPDLLREIAQEHLSLLHTSGATYETNGDYASSICSSGWCRFMDAASRIQCGSPDIRVALASGQWHCHESCWDASRQAMETRQPVDIPCKGGIRLYAMPIQIEDEVIGSINFGYGDPPKDLATLRELAERYGVTVEALQERSRQYESRPNFIIEVAKDQLHSSAKLLGEIVSRRRAETALRQLNETIEAQVKDRTAQLSVKQNQLRALAAQLSRTEERERKRLATDLHDNLAQLLALTKMKLKVAPTAGEPALRDAQVYVHQALTYTRTLLSELTPPLLGDKNDLQAAIGWVINKMERHGLHVVLHDDGAPKQMSEELLTVAYQAIQELLFNVLKHARTKEARLFLSWKDEGLEAVVADQGRGFDSALLPGPSKDGGFGLLNIRERVELLGGRLELTSSPGSGTRATLHLPLMIERNMNPIETAAHGNGPANGVNYMREAAGALIRIVLVDDHQMVREGFRSILEAYGDFTVVAEASDGQQAVEVVRQVRPDLVLMDINMPKMNGVEATRHILAENPRVRVIGLSMQDDPKIIDAMRDAGAVGYVSKAEAGEKLMDAVRTAWREERPTGSLPDTGHTRIKYSPRHSPHLQENLTSLS